MRRDDKPKDLRHGIRHDLARAYACGVWPVTPARAAAEPGGPAGLWLWLALGLNGFAIVTVTYWIYTARWEFIERNGETYTKPPTISRAISDPVIGDPFSVWITISSVCLVIGVGILALRHIGLIRRYGDCGRYLTVAALVGWPAVIVLQAASALGITWLSNYRFPDFNDMHMLGSYLFFISQALVVVLVTIFNHALLRERSGLALLVSDARVRHGWVRARYYAGLLSVTMSALYFGLFALKGIYEGALAPVLYTAYVSFELAALTSFMLVLGLLHGDLHGSRR